MGVANLIAMGKSQTATEYLIILAVVIVIAVIVVSAMGGIPGIGGSANEATARAKLASQTIGITSYAISDYDTILTVQNNNKDRVRVDTISIAGKKCIDIPVFSLGAGKKKQITCPNRFSMDSVAQLALEINWTDIETDATYSQSDPGVQLVGAVANKYQSILDNHPSYDSVRQGCWNWTDTQTPNPHPLCTCRDLANITYDVNTLMANYSVQNNIDLFRCNAGYDSGWSPIGTGVAPFWGNFNGNDYIISGLRGQYGLFGQTGVGGCWPQCNTIGNLSLVDVYIVGGSQLGALIGYKYATHVDNIYVTGHIEGGNYVGGIVGRMYGSLENVYADVTVKGGLAIGGLVGEMVWSNKEYGVRDSWSSGVVNGSGSQVGGAIGYSLFSANQVIDNVYSTANVYGGTAVGGLIGEEWTSVGTNNSYATGNVVGTTHVGGLIGYTNEGKITNSYATGKVTGSVAGGLIGYIDSNTDITNSWWVNHTNDDADACSGSDGSLSGCTP